MPDERPLKYCGYYPEVAERLAQQRDELRKKGKYDEADKLRQEIEKNGVEVMDGANGYLLRWLNRK